MVTIFLGDNSEVLRHLLVKLHISSTFLKKTVLASLPLHMTHHIDQNWTAKLMDTIVTLEGSTSGPFYGLLGPEKGRKA